MPTSKSNCVDYASTIKMLREWSSTGDHKATVTAMKLGADAIVALQAHVEELEEENAEYRVAKNSEGDIITQRQWNAMKQHRYTAESERDALRHDIARHVEIASEQAQEVEELRADLAAARVLADERDRWYRLASKLEVEARQLDHERDKLQADLAAARADIREMVEKAADNSLEGYRELGARAAAAENERDSLRAHLHDEHQRHVGTMDERDAALADLAAARADAERLRHDLNDMRAGHEVLARQLSISRELLVECAQAILPPWQNPDDPLWSLKSRIVSTFAGQQSIDTALAGEKK